MEEPYWAKYVLKWCQHKCDKGIELGLSEENTRRLGHDQTVKSSGLRFEFFFSCSLSLADGVPKILPPFKITFTISDGTDRKGTCLLISMSAKQKATRKV